MWVILLIALLLCFVLNPSLGIVIVVIGILGFVGFTFLLAWSDDAKEKDDPRNKYKFWMQGTVYTCSLSVSENEAFEVCQTALRKVGNIKSIDSNTHIITARFGSKFGAKITLMTYSIGENACRLIVVYKDTSAFIRAYDKMWYKTISAILEIIPSVKIDIKVSADKPKNLGVIEENSEDTKYLYSNGRLCVIEKNTAIFNDNMSGYDYEHFVAQCFKNSGFKNVSVTPKSGDYGADITMTAPDGVRICVQCKKSSSPIGVKAVQEVIGAKFHYKCPRGMVVTTSTFTPSAKELANEAGIELYENFRNAKADDLEWIDKIEEFDAGINE